MNKLTVVMDKLIYKRYEDINKCSSEYMAWKQLNNIIPNYVPDLVVKTPDLCVFEYLDEDNKPKSKKDLSTFVGKMMVEIAKKYNHTEYIKGELWNNSLKETRTKLSSNNNFFAETRNNKLYKILQRNLIKISKTKFDVVTFVHRDIHKGNLISQGGNYFLIDHEHAMEGPIELELQNSIFWNDKMSLNVKVVKKAILNSGMSYSDKNERLLLSYYIADQINIALGNNKPKKALKIMKKAIPQLELQ